MGQYHIPVNLDKREYICPHRLGAGLKLIEQIWNNPSIGAALIILTTCSNGRGGGDLGREAFGKDPWPVVGRWAGDRIAIVGDYAEDGDLDNSPVPASMIYDLCGKFDEYHKEKGIAKDDLWTDVSAEVCEVIEAVCHGKYCGGGWRDFKKNAA